MANPYLLVEHGSGEATEANLLKERWYGWSGTAMFSPEPEGLVSELLAFVEQN